MRFTPIGPPAAYCEPEAIVCSHASNSNYTYFSKTFQKIIPENLIKSNCKTILQGIG